MVEYGMKHGTPRIKEALMIKSLDKFHGYRDDEVVKQVAPIQIDMKSLKELVMEKENPVEKFEETPDALHELEQMLQKMN